MTETNLLDRIPELQELVTGMLTALMQINNDETLTLDDLADRVPELPALLDDAGDFICDLGQDGWLEEWLNEDDLDE